MKLILVAAVFAIAFTPLAVSAQARYSPVLSTSMQRTCQGEVGMTTLLDVYPGLLSLFPERPA